MDKLISVIVPVYKTEKYIRRCLDSLINQTYKNLEIIVVDDGTPDDAGRICDEYAKSDTRMKVIHQDNAGQSVARNNALKVATGEYYCFVDSDDYIALNMIERLCELLEINDSDISMVSYKTFEGDRADNNDILNDDNNTVSLMDNLEMIKNIHMVNDELYVVMWGKLFKRELFDNIEFPAGRICEDLYVLYHIYDKATKTVYSNEKLYYYYRGNVSSSTYSINQKFYDDVFWVLESEIEYMDVNHPELKAYPRRTYMYWIVDLCKKKGGFVAIGELKKYYKRYKTLYKESKEMKKEKFFTFFYYMPSLYVALKK